MRRPSRRVRWLIVAAAVVFEALPLWRRGYKLGGNVVVRCRAGHLFSTLWFPGVSVKAFRLGPRRLQRCPVGRHWSVVALVDRSQLSADELARARETHDIRIP
jgi:hypothetical protein